MAASSNMLQELESKAENPFSFHLPIREVCVASVSSVGGPLVCRCVLIGVGDIATQDGRISNTKR
jgi:hypothetical protein